MRFKDYQPVRLAIMNEVSAVMQKAIDQMKTISWYDENNVLCTGEDVLQVVWPALAANGSVPTIAHIATLRRIFRNLDRFIQLQDNDEGLVPDQKLEDSFLCLSEIARNAKAQSTVQPRPVSDPGLVIHDTAPDPFSTGAIPIVRPNTVRLDGREIEDERVEKQRLIDEIIEMEGPKSLPPQPLNMDLRVLKGIHSVIRQRHEGDVDDYAEDGSQTAAHETIQQQVIEGVESEELIDPLIYDLYFSTYASLTTDEKDKFYLTTLSEQNPLARGRFVIPQRVYDDERLPEWKDLVRSGQARIEDRNDRKILDILESGEQILPTLVAEYHGFEYQQFMAQYFLDSNSEASANEIKKATDIINRSRNQKSLILQNLVKRLNETDVPARPVTFVATHDTSNSRAVVDRFQSTVPVQNENQRVGMDATRAVEPVQELPIIDLPKLLFEPIEDFEARISELDYKQLRDEVRNYLKSRDTYTSNDKIVQAKVFDLYSNRLEIISRQIEKLTSTARKMTLNAFNIDKANEQDNIWDNDNGRLRIQMTSAEFNEYSGAVKNPSKLKGQALAKYNQSMYDAWFSLFCCEIEIIEDEKTVGKSRKKAKGEQTQKVVNPWVNPLKWAGGIGTGVALTYAGYSYLANSDQTTYVDTGRGKTEVPTPEGSDQKTSPTIGIGEAIKDATTMLTGGLGDPKKVSATWVELSKIGDVTTDPDNSYANKLIDEGEESAITGMGTIQEIDLTDVDGKKVVSWGIFVPQDDETLVPAGFFGIEEPNDAPVIKGGQGERNIDWAARGVAGVPLDGNKLAATLLSDRYVKEMLNSPFAELAAHAETIASMSPNGEPIKGYVVTAKILNGAVTFPGMSSKTGFIPGVEHTRIFESSGAESYRLLVIVPFYDQGQGNVDSMLAQANLIRAEQIADNKRRRSISEGAQL
jgi:hypothetical protein